MNNYETGRRGELAAQKFLENMGYEIITLNYRCKMGEIDIIAQKDNYIVFVEVKTRRNFKYGLPYESVSTQKQKKIRRVATYYLQANRIFNKDCRFDVVSIKKNSDQYVCEIIQDAF
ncbi:MAG: hypothetical protein APF76_04900 [Desulfitibacter sp. BRH_c19]|nr:MAG: hypothetical protein APF76_04900 [Desulfitibacter sp. BRH_c19]